MSVATFGRLETTDAFLRCDKRLSVAPGLTSTTSKEHTYFKNTHDMRRDVMYHTLTLRAIARRARVRQHYEVCAL
eukprot:4776899-Pleurochrysis_carterae.AAC.1